MNIIVTRWADGKTAWGTIFTCYKRVPDDLACDSHMTIDLASCWEGARRGGERDEIETNPSQPPPK